MVNLRKINNILFSLLFILTLNACFSVQVSMTGANINPAAKTFSVKYFVNRASLAPSTVGQTFTDALKEKFESQTALQLSTETGDIAFEGEITGYSTKPVSIQANETAAQNRLTITVRVKFINALEPDKNFDKSFSYYEDFASSKSLNSVENELIRVIFETITDDVFNAAVVNW